MEVGAAGAMAEGIAADSVMAMVIAFLEDLGSIGGVIPTGGTLTILIIIITPIITRTTILITMGVMANRRCLRKG